MDISKSFKYFGCQRDSPVFAKTKEWNKTCNPLPKKQKKYQKDFRGESDGLLNVS